MLSALGYRFFDGEGALLCPCSGEAVPRVASIDPSLADPRLREVEFMVACDVSTVFADAPAVFGPQKGATPEMVKTLTEGMLSLSSVHRGRYLQKPRRRSRRRAGSCLFGVLERQTSPRDRACPRLCRLRFIFGRSGHRHYRRRADRYPDCPRQDPLGYNKKSGSRIRRGESYPDNSLLRKLCSRRISFFRGNPDYSSRNAAFRRDGSSCRFAEPL